MSLFYENTHTFNLLLVRPLLGFLAAVLANTVKETNEVSDKTTTVIYGYI